MKKVFLDTNILLDDILAREPFATDSRMLLRYCVSSVDGFIAAHSLTESVTESMLMYLFMSFPCLTRESIFCRQF